MSGRKFIEIEKSFFVDPEFVQAFGELGLTSMDAVFSFNAGKDFPRYNLPQYRTRLEFKTANPVRTLFLKRYNKPSIFIQIRNWFWHRSRQSTMSYDMGPVTDLAKAGIRTPKVISYGEQWGILFEKRSFSITEEITNARPLEEKLPDCFEAAATEENIHKRKEFIEQLAAFAKKFHDTGFRHRDFYLPHIFYGEGQGFWLIDLQRIFKPRLLAERFLVKDICQLHYSAPGSAFSNVDRIRFYKNYTGRKKLNSRDKRFIRRVIKKARQIARHDTKHGMTPPFTN